MCFTCNPKIINSMKNFLFLSAATMIAATQVCVNAATKVVENYTYDFNEAYGTLDSNGNYVSETAAPANWGHVLDDGGLGTYPVYRFMANDGVDNSACLYVWNTVEYDEDFGDIAKEDMLVTPPVEGNISIMVKKYFTWGSVKFYVVTPNGDSWNIGTELTGTPAEELSTDKFVKVQVANVPQNTRVGVWANQVQLDDFKADKATIDVVETGVNDVNVATPSSGRHTIYTLGGQRIDAPVSSLDAGVYIIDGVKVKK